MPTTLRHRHISNQTSPGLLVLSSTFPLIAPSSSPINHFGSDGRIAGCRTRRWRPHLKKRLIQEQAKRRHTRLAATSRVRTHRWGHLGVNAPSRSHMCASGWLGQWAAYTVHREAVGLFSFVGRRRCDSSSSPSLLREPV
ncbi:hypothetical protein K458DRAFT_76622 [Lentithecium fluviatile CBS 122367]|uniref:Uncharacterized protein n=1 Tax=Lentithecium fluviatile CBS 122367 TaxID=1168545 RepID=A0A6G1ITQ1_9PLEO|nr:hypothetical protein K458DRAFT_76622 [Lentithecium fluviatile CBS 122367]